MKIRKGHDMIGEVSVAPGEPPSAAAKRFVYEHTYSDTTRDKWAFHDTLDPIVRYTRDRRLKIAIEHLMAVTGQTPTGWDALVVCGGVGGEGTFLANLGFRSVTVADFSHNALMFCRSRDPRLRTCTMDAEQLAAADKSYSVVLVQDGLHELRRPVTGLTEMLRVARTAVVVIEPHTGVVARILGTTWEYHEGVANFVFRWNESMFEQVSRSYLMHSAVHVKTIRLWDHNETMQKLGAILPDRRAGLALIKSSYALLDGLLRPLGNMMIGIVVRKA